MLNVLLIEDERVDHLYPFSLTHNSWELRIGAFSIRERWSSALSDTRIVVYTHRTSLQNLAAESHVAQNLEKGIPLLVMVSTCVLAPEEMRRLATLALKAESDVALMCGAYPVGAILRTSPAHPGELPTVLDALGSTEIGACDVKGRMITRLWDVLDVIEDGVTWDAELVEYQIHPTALVHQSAVIDVSKGPVIVGEDAEIGAMAIVQGPCVVADHAVVKPLTHVTHSVIGPHCKIGGEVSCSVLLGYSNKQHYGFLGHSVVGEWVNLGAGTTTSNLKNTYNDVRPTMPWARESSSRMFLGSLIGDFTRTAIGTLLPTGGVYGVCSHVMAEGLAPSSRRSFVWSEGVPYEYAAALQTCDVMMKRRGRRMTDALSVILNEVRERDV
jgi:acetyltransferase-like isoleucine patch superfamily enzyme